MCFTITTSVSDPFGIPRSHLLRLKGLFAEDQCPDAYAYAYDESSGTALWTCDSNLSSDYTLVFCP